MPKDKTNANATFSFPPSLSSLSATRTTMTPPLLGRTAVDKQTRPLHADPNKSIQWKLPAVDESRELRSAVVSTPALDPSVAEFLSLVQACPTPLPRSKKIRNELSTETHGKNKKRAIPHVVSSPALAAFSVSAMGSSELDCAPLSPVAQTKKARVHHSVSAPALSQVIFGGASASTASSTKDVSKDEFANTNPQDHLQTILMSQGITADTRPALSMNDGFFLETTEDHIAGYGTDIINAVRQEDLEALSRIRDSGATLQCCNRFGESIVHMACRKGSLGVLNFLLSNGVSIRLRDDYGRTPLHDACWTREPQFEMVKRVIEECPDLLHVQDKRGFTPLSYVRRDHWGDWCHFLEDHSDLVVPKELLKN